MRGLLVVLLALFACPAWAQVEVSGAWVRSTVEGQMGTGAFMTLRSKDTVRVVGAASPAAGVVEIHEMAMQGGVMRMRAIESLELPAGRPVELKPGGYHVMLMDLQRPLKPGDKVQLELRLKTADNRMVTQPVELQVLSRPPAHPANK